MSLPATPSVHRIGITARALFSILPSGAGLVVLATLLLSGCSKNKATTAPVSTYSLTGRVRLVGHLSDINGDLTGERVINDADGVRVYLVSGGSIVDSAVTQDGVFGFRVALGTYFAFAGVTQGTADSTAQLHVHETDRVFPDPIDLGSAATLKEFPNPFTGSIRLRFSLPTAGDVRVEVHTLGGSRVKTLVAESLPAGAHEVVWDGLDDAGHSAPIGLYWVVLDRSNLHAAALLFREEFALSLRAAARVRLSRRDEHEAGSFVSRSGTSRFRSTSA